VSANRSPRLLSRFLPERTTGRLFTQTGCASGDRRRGPLGRRDRRRPWGVAAEGWPRAHRAFAAHAQRLLSEPEPVRVLGNDETRRPKPRWKYSTDTSRWVRVDPWDTGFVDLASTQGMSGQTAERTTAAVVAWLSERTPQLWDASEYVAIDPAAVRTPGCCPTRRWWWITSISWRWPMTR